MSENPKVPSGLRKSRVTPARNMKWVPPRLIYICSEIPAPITLFMGEFLLFRPSVSAGRFSDAAGSFPRRRVIYSTPGTFRGRHGQELRQPSGVDGARHV